MTLLNGSPLVLSPPRTSPFFFNRYHVRHLIVKKKEKKTFGFNYLFIYIYMYVSAEYPSEDNFLEKGRKEEERKI